MAWERYLKIVVDYTKVDSNLTDFPLAIALSSSAGTGSGDVSAIFDELGANKYKLKLEDSSDNQKYVEIESWDETAEKALLHAKVALSSTVDTVFKLYYDSTQADNTTYIGVAGETAADNVWDSNFAAVYHMSQDPTGGGAAVKDSTSNENNGTPTGSMTESDLVDSNIGKALDFDGADDIVSVSSDSSIDNIDPKTIDMKFNADSWGQAGYGRIARKVLGWYVNLNADSGKENLFFTQDFDSVSGVWSTPTESIALSTDHCASIAYDRSSTSNDPSIFLDAVSQSVTEATAPVGTAVSDAVQVMWIGARQTGASGRFFDGEIAEFRLSDIVRSDAWIKATHLSLDDNILAFTAFKVSGTVKEGAANIARTVRAYSRETGALLGSDTSSAVDGTFEISGLTWYDDIQVIALDDAAGTDYNDLIYSTTPVEV